ncbi:MAG: ABC transporter permease [Lachnospiraceae bacterium]|nr:ABC transporter permease [Lachnospiraceae bacterium]
MTVWKHEMKMNKKALCIWTLCVGMMCFGCILMYTSLEDSLQDMADMYSNMGALSVAMGMDKMSLATLVGFYATEILMLHGLGGAMFAAITGTGMLSKEEAGHTSEFLYVFPLGRICILLQKYLALLCNIFLFNFVCILFYVVGFFLMGEEIQEKEMMLSAFTQLLMQIEIGTICFCISAFVRKNLLGAGLGIVIFFFATDMMCRIIPAIENIKYFTPFYYANGADIFTRKSIEGVMTGIGAGMAVIAFFVGCWKYHRKDLT